jgi:hypothetical protein
MPGHTSTPWQSPLEKQEGWVEKKETGRAPYPLAKLKNKLVSAAERIFFII